MAEFGLRGEKVRLVPVDRDKHLENYVRWFNDPEVTKWLLLTMPMMKIAEEKWFERIAESTTDIVFAIEDLDGNHIGTTGIHRINWQHGRATTGIVIGDKSYWGKRFASDVMRIRTRYAFEMLGLRRLESEAFVENASSRACLEKIGYKLSGIEPERTFRHGKYRDIALYYFLAKDYFAQQDKTQSTA